jgi:hypothetical protein
MPETIDVALEPPVIHIERSNFPVNLAPSERALAIATEFTIPDDDDGSMLQVASDEVNDALARHDQLEAMRKELVKPFDEGREKVQSWFRGPQARWKQIAAIYKEKAAARQRKIVEDRRKAQAKIEEDNRRAQAAAEAKAAEERAKAAKQAEELQRKAAAAAAAGKVGEAAKLAVQAENKIEAGEVRAQAAVIEAGVAMPAVVLPPVQKVQGLASVTTYDVEDEIDVLGLAAFIVLGEGWQTAKIAHPEYRNLIQGNRSALRSQAIAMKDAFNIGGCKLKVTETSRRSGR